MNSMKLTGHIQKNQKLGVLSIRERIRNGVFFHILQILKLGFAKISDSKVGQAILLDSSNPPNAFTPKAEDEAIELNLPDCSSFPLPWDISF